ncbi:MAG: AAA family ATPase [Acidobacteria bacterium]|nr:AAA family ATPase [Acidobacteriota bacterium]
MELKPQIIFSPFRFDIVNQCLWRDEQAIALTPKAFALLNYLIERAGQLVTKEELLNAVWPETYVSDAVLKVCVGELRKALGDDAKSAKFIETLHRRGYRFIGQIAVAREGEKGRSGEGERKIAVSPTLRLSGAHQRLSMLPMMGLVGREAALAQMRDWLSRALGGERQVIFVTGEAGIGKTALLEAFRLSLAAEQHLKISYGQCLEQYGAGEAYLPVLEAISRLCREPGGKGVVDLLRRHAPTWLFQMPSLVNAAERQALQQEMMDVTRDRMLREMAETLEALSAETPLVLVLEDLHWSDYSTLDLVSYLARRGEKARLMLIGTYRPAEILLSEHPLKSVKQDLQMKRHCEELSLEDLSQWAISEYLTARFPQNEFPHELSRLIHERTEGNPLFMVNVVDYLHSAGLIARTDKCWRLQAEMPELQLGVPETIRQMIEKQVGHLSQEEQRLLETASVVGAEFPSAMVALIVGRNAVEIEEMCESLARRRQFLQSSGLSEWPDGTVTTRYGFIHALYQNTLYDRLAAARRAQLHLLIGKQGERIFGERAAEIAAELAVHFERGRDHRRAVKYLLQAADNANRRFAHREAAALARQGLELLKNLQDANEDVRERSRQELMLQMSLCTALPPIEGYGAAIVERTHNRARELCQQLGESVQLFRVLRGLRGYYMFRAEVKTACEISEQLLGLAQSRPDTALLVQAHWALGFSLFHIGEFAKAIDHCEQGLALYDSQQQHYHLSQHRYDPGAALRNGAAWTKWFLGYPDQSLDEIRKALALAREARHPENLCLTLFCASFLYQLHRDSQSTREQAEELIARASQYGLTPWIAIGTSLRGWALTRQGQKSEGIALIRQTLADHGRIGSEIARIHFLGLLAEALLQDEQTEEGLAIVSEVLSAVHHIGVHYFEAELHRLKGELLLKVENRRSRIEGRSPHSLASQEECFHQAIDIARRQRARSLELRAVMSLARLWKQQGKRAEAREVLAETYGRFTEGFDTADHKDAGAFLEELT